MGKFDTLEEAVQATVEEDLERRDKKIKRSQKAQYILSGAFDTLKDFLIAIIGGLTATFWFYYNPKVLFDYIIGSFLALFVILLAITFLRKRIKQKIIDQKKFIEDLSE